MSKKKNREIPIYPHPIIETHCHLDYLEQDELDTVLQRSAEVGVSHIMTIAVSPDNLVKVRNLSQRYPQVSGTQGIHPHEAENYSDAVEAEIREFSHAPGMVAIGEIGLDYYYDHADRQVQRRVFENQLQIAVDKDLPVVIHTREADEDTIAILKNFESTLSRKGVIHSFTSTLELAEYCTDTGFALGFNGITTFNRAENVREVVAATDIRRILLETDAPYLTPVPYRGRPNAPFYLPFIAEKIAEVKNLGIAEVLQQTYQNSLDIFFPDGLPN